MNTNKTKTMEERFDERFVEMHFCIEPILYSMKFDDINKIKSFIKSEIDLAIEKRNREIVKDLRKKVKYAEDVERGHIVLPAEHLLKLITPKTPDIAD